MSRSRSRVNVAFMEDCDEDSSSSPEAIQGSRIYAMSEAPSAPPSPPRKETPNTGKSRSNDHYRSSRRGVSSESSSDSTSRSSRRERAETRREREARKIEEQRQKDDERRRRDEKRERDARRAKAEERAQNQSSKALKKVRPAGLKHSVTQPIIQQSGSRMTGHDDPRAYGVPHIASSGPRPRASTRPASYYHGQPPRPPPSNTGFPPGHGPPPPPSPFQIGTFPPPQMYPMGPPSMHGGPPSSSPGGMTFFDGGPPPHFPGRDLRSRFEPRPQSAMGFSPSQRSYIQDQYSGYDDEPPQRAPSRPSRPKKHEHDNDRKRMPPPDYIPMRPRTTANSSMPFNPPPPRPASRHAQAQSRPKPQRRSMGYPGQIGYDDEDFLGDDMYQDIMPGSSYDSRRGPLTRTRRRDSLGDDDDDEEYDIVPSSGMKSRRGSMYSAALGTGGVSLEDAKYLDALRYQDELGEFGGPSMPLTAETLRKANRRGEGSSRSTRSSGSRDDSEYKRSNTTGITQSSNGDDFTIKVSGAAVVRLGGAEIECEDSEITFSNRNGISRFGSDQASTVYQIEDTRSRVERKALPLPHRPRAPSQSDSQSRGYAASHAPYDAGHAPYDPTFSSYYLPN